MSCAFVLVHYRSAPPESHRLEVASLKSAPVAPPLKQTLKPAISSILADALTEKKELPKSVPSIKKGAVTPFKKVAKKVSARLEIKKSSKKNPDLITVAKKENKKARPVREPKPAQTKFQISDEDAISALLGKTPLEKPTKVAEAEPTEISDALPQAVVQMIDRSFDEPSLTDDYQSDWKTSAAQNDDSDLDNRLPVERSYAMVLGTYQQENFDDLKEGLKKLQANTPEALVEPPSIDTEPVKETPAIAANEGNESSEDGDSAEVAVPKVTDKLAGVPTGPVVRTLDAREELAAMDKAKGPNESTPKQNVTSPFQDKDLKADDAKENPKVALNDSLAKETLPELTKDKAEAEETPSANKSEPTLVTPDVTKPAEESGTSEPEVSESSASTPTLVNPLTSQSPSEINESLNTPSATASTHPAAPSTHEPELIVPPQLVVKAGPVPPPEKIAKAPTAPGSGQAEVQPENVPTPSVTEPTLVKPRWQISKSPPPTQEQLEKADSAAYDVGTILGTFTVDSTMDRWIDTFKGHIELHLEPISRADRTNQDLIRLDYSYPTSASGDRFKISTRPMHDDTYVLYARVYGKTGLSPVASIPYRDHLTSHYASLVRFNVNWSDFTGNQLLAKKPTANKVIGLTLFVGGTGDKKNIPRVANAQVSVIGWKEWGTITSNERGNIRIPNVPSHSEFLLNIDPPHDPPLNDFYKTQKIVSVIGMDAYDNAKVISKDKANAVKYWTHEDPDSTKGIVMGEVNNPETGGPEAGVHVTLSYEKNHALYIDALPDPLLPATTKTGMFGFFNVVSSWRYLAAGVLPILTHVRPNYAQWFDIGRAGTNYLVGRIYDNFNNTRPAARIRVVGQKEWAAVTDEKGNFSLKVNLPAGVIPLEVESEGSATATYTFPYDPTQKIFRRLYEIPEALVKDSALGIARIRALDPTKGNIMGGAEPYFFGQRTGCSHVELYDEYGNLVALHGPYPWGSDEDVSHGLCLNAEMPRYAFYNLDPGLYVVKWVDDQGVGFASHVVYVQMGGRIAELFS